MKKNIFGRKVYNECSAFLEKLFYFVQVESIKRIMGNWRKEISDMLVSFKTDDIIIEKKTPTGLAKEE
jgi:hypothetical protein